ncbi:MAG TPA: vanadium-dependent haloperoxidase [Steroidobacteraceae bacterium]|nr:vanadium-dependent haloperoxidase [Steroidobacteraceae bacterium]
MHGMLGRVAPILWLLARAAHADVIADWADKTSAIASDGANTIRTMALAQSAVYEAVNAITARYPRDRVDLGPAPGASIEAAVAAANRGVLLAEETPLKARIEAAYAQALEALPDGEARRLGVALGERAAADVLAKHAGEIGNLEPYRPVTSPGVYVPTTIPTGWSLGQHKPWFLKSAAQLRPPAPPALKSALWARDYNEIKALGSVSSATRTDEQTQIARFWATALPDIHIGLLRSVDTAPGRDITRNARLYAAAVAAMSDTEVAVFEAKYFYLFWRPITAIRNGDRDDNPATERDADWVPLITTPMQPEYPCAHCMLAAAVATVIRADNAGNPAISLSTISNTAPGVTRRWANTDELVREVFMARIWAGVHYRNSAEVGQRMGEQVGKIAAAAYGLR